MQLKGISLKECFSSFLIYKIILGIAISMHQWYLILMIFYFKPLKK